MTGRVLAIISPALINGDLVWKREQLGLERVKGGGCGHVRRQAGVPVDYGVQKVLVLPVVCSTTGYRVGKWMGGAGSFDSGLLGWCVLAVDGHVLPLGEYSIV